MARYLRACGLYLNPVIITLYIITIMAGRARRGTMTGDGGETRVGMEEIGSRRTAKEDGRRVDGDGATFIFISIVTVSRETIFVGIVGMTGGSTVGARRTRTGGVRTCSAAEEEKEAGGRRMRMMRRRMRREVMVGGRYDTDHTLYCIVNTVILHTITCTINASGSLLLGKFVTAPTFESIIHHDIVYRTCGGPAPSAAPHHPEVLLSLPSRTLGGESMPDKRTSPPRGAGPKLPWQSAKAFCMYMTDAGTKSKRVTSPPPRGGRANCPQLPRPPSVMAMAGRRSEPPSAIRRTARLTRNRMRPRETMGINTNLQNGSTKLFV